MKKKIVCATDFSASSDRMANAAAAIAAKLGEPLVLVHVIETSSAAGEALAESLRNAAKERLHAKASLLREKGAVVVEELLDGSPYEAITNLAAAIPARMIVMASQKKRGLLERWFSGGLVERVVKNSQVPTLVLRDPSALEQWTSGEKPLRIFVAADLSTMPDAPLLWAKELASIAPCEITAAYVNWVPDEAIRLGLSDTPSFFQSSHQLQSLLEKELREKVTRLVGDLPVTIKVEPRWGRADLPLIGMAELSDSDLIVAGTRSRGGLARMFDESVSLDLLHHAPMGVALVPLLENTVDAPLPSFERVLVPTDFSDLANHAIPYACAIAARGGKVCIAHVTGRLGLTEEEATAKLVALIPPQATERGIQCETAVWKGEADAEGIGHLAARFRADAICIGSHGRSGISRAVLGSVTQAIVSSSKCPVMIVRKPV